MSGSKFLQLPDKINFNFFQVNYLDFNIYELFRQKNIEAIFDKKQKDPSN